MGAGQGRAKQAAGAGSGDAAASDAAPVPGSPVAALAGAGMPRKAQGMGWVLWDGVLPLKVRGAELPPAHAGRG